MHRKTSRLIFLSIGLLLLVGGIWGYWHKLDSLKEVRAGEIVSLGDSVAAGAGLQPLATPSSTDTACGHSRQSYSVLVGQMAKLPLRQFACGGAKITAGLLQPQTAGGKRLPSQLDQASKYITANTVLLSIGANDVGWSDLLLRCAQTTCIDNTTLMTDYQSSLRQLDTNLKAVLQAINKQQPNNIIVTNYYELLSPNDTCYADFGITPDKIAWVNARERELTTIIASRAQEAGAVIIRPNFSGHELCSSDSYIQGPLDPAPLHPNAKGQRQIARQNLDAVLRGN